MTGFLAASANPCHASASPAPHPKIKGPNLTFTVRKDPFTTPSVRKGPFLTFPGLSIGARWASGRRW